MLNCFINKKPKSRLNICEFKPLLMAIEERRASKEACKFSIVIVMGKKEFLKKFKTILI